ncbi:Sua5 family C-terminal domain-containing protein, partial [Senegalia sp. (in: firmicutes)]
RKNPKEIAAKLFFLLRKFDKMNVDIILAEGIEEIGIGSAIMNRMKKAAGFDIEKV